MAMPIRDLGRKLKVAIDTLLTSERQHERLLEICNGGRHGHAILDRVGKGSIVEALGIKASNLSNWLSDSAKGLSPGRLLDLAALLGFGPDEATLADLASRYVKANGSSPYPRRIHQMMSPWDDGSAACRCWSAFAGSATQLAEVGLPANTLYLGGTAQEFEALYRKHLDDLTSRLLDEVHWEESLPLRTAVRARTLPSIYKGPQESGSADVAEEANTGEERNAAPLPLPSWLTAQAGQAPLLDRGILAGGRSEAEIEGKAQLYGGDAAPAYTPLEAVAMGHTFDRTSVAELQRAIEESAEPSCSFTLKAHRGTGLSIALAQLVRDLSKDPGNVVLSVIGSPTRTALLLSQVDETKAVELATWAASKRSDLKRVVIVIDDVASLRRNGSWPLIRFRWRCRAEFEALGGPRLAFVFGSFGTARTLHEDGLVKLEMTDEDRSACYQVMAETQPAIVSGVSGGLSKLLLAYPAARTQGDDPQALIDFLLQHAGAKEVTVERWLARTADLDAAQTRALVVVAAAALVDLPVPEPVAKSVFSEIPGLASPDLEAICNAIDRLSVVEHQWRGIALSCPRRAMSILERTETFGQDRLGAVFSTLVAHALRIYETRGPHAAEGLEFARHIIQRLGKQDLYPFAGKQRIFATVIDEFVRQAPHVGAGWTIAQRARWAGTLAPGLSLYATRARGNGSSALDSERACAWMIGELSIQCARFLVPPSRGLTSEIAVSLLRASRLLSASGYYSEEALDLSVRLSAVFSAPSLIRVLQAQESEGENRALRANELLHAYCQFRAAFESEKARSRTTATLEEMIRFLEHARVPLDAGTWIERARHVRSDHGGAESDVTRRKRVAFLSRAEECIAFNPMTQATWMPHLRRERRSMDRGDVPLQRVRGDSR